MQRKIKMVKIWVVLLAFAEPELLVVKMEEGKKERNWIYKFKMRLIP